MAKTIEQLKAQSAEIKNATVVGENTATRVGALFNDIVDALAEEKAATIGTERIADKAVILSKLSDEIVNSSKAKNRFNTNDPNIKVGYYLNQDGDLIANSAYIVSGYIPFSENDSSLICSIDGTANGGGGYSELYDSQKNRITGFISNSTNGILKWQEGVAYARFSISTGAIGRNIQIEKGEKITAYEPYFGSEFCFQESLIPTLTTDKLADGAVTTSKIAKDAVTSVNIADEAVGLAELSSEIIEKSGGKNRFNPNDPDVVVGYYLNQDGDLKANSSYIVSGYIPFSEEDGSLISSYNNGRVNDGGGFSELYDSQKNRITGFINSSTNGILKWQEGVAYARFSIQTENINNNIQVEQGESITAYEPYVAGSHIKESLIPALNDLNPIKSLAGKEAETATVASLTDTGKIELADFPWHIKKGLVMSMYAKVTSFSALLVGKGYKKYRGDYLRINATQIIQIRYESSEIVKETVTHGLNIQTFVKVSLTSDNSGQMYVVLQSKGGKFEYTFKNWAFEANYAPFALSEGSTLTDVELSAGCQDFRLPVWAFGDSYFGVDASRWIGVMKDFGYFNFLVNGLAGQSSAGAYADLERCLKFGTPKFLLWCLGMNDTDANFKSYFEKVRSICKNNDITLITATVPTVPTRNKEIITKYVKDSGLRYIDFYKAVGTSSSGTWYDGYLNADGVHPNAIGAQALATQVLADFPELMQYGKTVEHVITSTVNEEAKARTKNDETLNTAIVAEKNRAEAAEKANITAIKAETARAQAAEQANADNISKLFNITDEPFTYGIEFDTEISSPNCTRIGNPNLHRSLPVQNNMRGCLLDDDGNVVEYLDANDWTGNTRDGSKGQVMVEIPTHYRKFEEKGTKRRVLLSELPLAGFERVPKCYVSAYEATVQRSTSKLCSVANINEDYRGGNNKSSLDGQYNSFLGRPATSISRTSFRNYARKRKSGSTEWNCYTYDIHKTLFWLFVVEYATLNSQAGYNSEPTSEGYRQGGLGAGVTTWDGTWSSFNGYCPFVPCGHTDSLGNRTGVVSYTAKNDDESISKTFEVPRYRGVENPFGHIWKWTDGCNIQVSASQENGGTGLSKAFICHNPANFQDSNYANYSHVGNIDRVGGYIKEVLFGVGGEILPKLAGGGSTTYFCDNHWTSISTSGEALRGLLFGGDANSGAVAGLAFAHSFYAPSRSYSHIGSRLCFIPSEA